MKYKYGKRHDSECVHDWGKPIGHDKTQFCKKCNQWRALKGDENE